MAPITAEQVAEADAMSAWGAAHVERPAALVRLVNAALTNEDANTGLEAVGRVTRGLSYRKTYLADIGHDITVGFIYTPAEKGDEFQPETHEDFEPCEFWLDKVNIAALIDDHYTDKLIDQIKAGS